MLKNAHYVRSSCRVFFWIIEREFGVIFILGHTEFHGQYRLLRLHGKGAQYVYISHKAFLI